MSRDHRVRVNGWQQACAHFEVRNLPASDDAGDHSPALAQCQSRDTMFAMLGVCALCIVACAAAAAAGRAPGPPTSAELDAPLTRLAFGSCNKHDFPQPAWRAIQATQPDAFLWLGDVVYADVRVWKRPLSAPLLFEPAPLDSVRAKLAAQQSHAAYANLRNSTPIIGIWDDHDSAGTADV